MDKCKVMRLEFGPFPNVCANCRHLKVDYLRRTARKCEIYDRSSSEATDWAATWPACGAFNQDVKERDLFKKLNDKKRKPKEVEQLDGQIDFAMEVSDE